MDLYELNSIKPQFEDCNKKIIETARTGSTNKCIFNIKRGEISGRIEGIYYSLLSTASICDESPLVELDPRNHIYQECIVSGGYRLFGMLWKFPSTINVTGNGVQGTQMIGETEVAPISFGPNIIFDTLSLYVNFDYQANQTGNVIELSRFIVNQNNVTLRVKIS